MSTYCAPCLADLALVREAVTTVSGTAACVAHAVLLTHPADNAQRRLTRLSDLRAMAEEKLPTASDEDRPKIELLVQEYALAGAMDMTVPLKELAGDRSPRPPKNRRDRDRNRGERGPRPDGERGPRGPRPDGERGEGQRGQGDGGHEHRPEAPGTDTPAGASELSGAGGAPAPAPSDSSQTPAATPELSDAGGAPAPTPADNPQTPAPEAPAAEQAGGEQ